jgi:hypothetical protein
MSLLSDEQYNRFVELAPRNKKSPTEYIRSVVKRSLLTVPPVREASEMPVPTSNVQQESENETEQEWRPYVSTMPSGTGNGAPSGRNRR